MNRRALLKLLSMGVIGHTLDIDKLLWIPGQKKIFLPTVKSATYTEIIACEWERVIPKVKELFDKDDEFYYKLMWKEAQPISNRSMKISIIGDINE